MYNINKSRTNKAEVKEKFKHAVRGKFNVLVLSVLLVPQMLMGMNSNPQGTAEDPFLRYCFLRQIMNEHSFNIFLDKMSAARKKIILQSGNPEEQKPPYTAEAVRKKILWESSHWLTYAFKNKEQVNYHEIVRWVAKEMEVADYRIEHWNTFQLEREIICRIISKNWDLLTKAQRENLLERIDPKHTIADHAGIASMSGGVAVMALSGTVLFSGFSFYTTTTTLMAAIASTLGVVLPFSTYLTTTTAIGILSGPIGWGVSAVSLLGGTLLLGQADATDTIKTIIGIHCVKVDCIQSSGLQVNDFLAKQQYRPVLKNSVSNKH